MMYSATVTVPGRPEDVIVRFTDVKRMATCIPGASVEALDQQGNYAGTITVSFGPKKIKFTGTVACTFDIPNLRGAVTGRGTAALKTARVSIKTDFSVQKSEAEAEHPLSLVVINSEVEFGGMLAEFAGSAGEAVANALLEEFSRNVAVEFSTEDARVDTVKEESVSAHKLLWQAVKTKLK